MSDKYMILPAKDAAAMRLVRMPDDIESQEAFRHVTGIIAGVEVELPDYEWEDIATALEDQGFEPVEFILGPSLD